MRSQPFINACPYDDPTRPDRTRVVSREPVLLRAQGAPRAISSWSRIWGARQYDVHGGADAWGASRSATTVKGEQMLQGTPLLQARCLGFTAMDGRWHVRFVRRRPGSAASNANKAFDVLKGFRETVIMTWCV